MQRRLAAIFVTLAVTGCAARTRVAPTVPTLGPQGLGLVHIVAAIPAFDAESAMRDANSAPMFALTGTVVDLESGQPLVSSEIIVRRPSDGKIVSTLTDGRGGFMVPRIPPGQYGLIVRRVGYEPMADLRDARAGAIDTLRLKMLQTENRVQGTRGGRSAAFRY